MHNRQNTFVAVLNLVLVVVVSMHTYKFAP